MVTSRILFTAKQKDELWERWKNGQSVLAISRALERRNKTGVRRGRGWPRRLIWRGWWFFRLEALVFRLLVVWGERYDLHQRHGVACHPWPAGEIPLPVPAFDLKA